MFLIDEGFYVNKIKQIINNAKFRQFSSVRMKLIRLSNFRPDQVSVVIETAQKDLRHADAQKPKH